MEQSEKNKNPKTVFTITKEVRWTKLEDRELGKMIKVHGKKNWEKVFSLFKNKTSKQCCSRFKLLREKNITKGRWTEEEDKLILEMYEKVGQKWSKISKVLKTRTGKQIRERFVNRLDASVKKNCEFTLEEDLKILKLHQKFGNLWTHISKHFEGRSPDNIKIRFNNSIIKKINILLFLERRDHGVTEVRIKKVLI